MKFTSLPPTWAAPVSIFTGDNDADIPHNSALVNLNVLEALGAGRGEIFYSSSACIYPQYNQQEPSNPNCAEDSTYPADPDSEYGWEKLFSERLYLSFCALPRLFRHIARYHNISDLTAPGTAVGKRPPAALCRKVAQAKSGDSIDIWGDGEQTRSFMYIDDCLEGTLRLTRSDFAGPVNIGSEEMVTASTAGANGHGHRRQETGPALNSRWRARPQFLQIR